MSALRKPYCPSSQRVTNKVVREDYQGMDGIAMWMTPFLKARQMKTKVPTEEHHAEKQNKTSKKNSSYKCAG